ncbi:MAG: PDDEXK nuclease domain-containing protein [Candidatus Competibacteraceae bacterium]
MSQDISQTDAYRDLIANLKSRIQSAQIKAAVTVNTQLITLYWDIGQQIAEKQRSSGWGDAVIEQIAQDLTREFKTMKGFSRRNLYRMKRFYAFYASQDPFVPQAVAQIPWGHNDLIIQRVNERNKALWYVQKTLENGWSRSVLDHQIESQLYERQAEKPRIDNFTERLPAPQSDLARQTLKDPYLFDFLNIGEEAHERELETALVDRITRFMLELGKGFAFVGRQYHLEVGGDDFYIDLLFYHLRLHCYVAVELKTGPFKPEYTGKLNFYLTALDEQVKMPEDSPSIGLILCRDRNNVVAEYALRDVNKPIGISRYALAATLPEELRASFPTVEEVEAELGKIACVEAEEAINTVEPAPEQASQPTEQQEQEILDVVKAVRREEGKKRRRQKP